VRRRPVRLGSDMGPFDELAPDEWVMVAPYCADAGTSREVIASFGGRRRLRITDVTGTVVGAVALKGRRVPIPEDALEAGVAAEPSCVLKIPDETPGGIYFIDDRWAFLVSRPAARCTVVISVSTMQAFNNWGGRSEYSERKRQRAIGEKTPLHFYSLRRPLSRRYATDVLTGFLEWLPRGALAGEDIAFIPDCDLARPDALAATTLLLIPGRSEYWSRESRKAIDAYVARGGDMVLLSSETMLHEVRHEDGRNAWWWRGSPENPERPPTPYWDEPDRNYPLIPSIGPNPADGGSHKPEAKKYPEWGVYRAVDTSSPLAHACGIKPGDAVALPSMVYYDGLPVTGYAGNVPVLDDSVLPFHKWTLIAHSFGHDTPRQRIGAWFAFQRTATSGRCVHFGSYGWSGKDGLSGRGPGGTRPAEIVDAAIRLLRTGENIFGAASPIPAPPPWRWLRRLRYTARRRRA
jgi:hypothetical protein